jgi:hypothetical protein
MVAAHKRTYPVPYKEMFLLTEKALQNLNYEIIAKDFKKGRILASTGLRDSIFLNQWGTLIYVFIGVRKELTSVLMKSKTVFWTSKIEVMGIFYELDRLAYSTDEDLIEEPKKAKTTTKYVVKNPKAVCPNCHYFYTSMSTIEDPKSISAISICPRCHEEFHYIIPEELKPKIEKFVHTSKGSGKMVLTYFDTTRLQIYAFLTILFLFVFFVFVDYLFLRLVWGMVLIYYIAGFALIRRKRFKMACVLCGTIVAILTTPMLLCGFPVQVPALILGLIASDLAWKYHIWEMGDFKQT